MKMTRRFRTFWTDLLGDRSGGILIYAAIVAPVIIGMAGLSIDVGLWYAQKRLIQSAADSAALAGSLEVLRSGSDSDAIVAAVSADAAINGYGSASGDTIAVATQADTRVEVTITRPTSALLGQFVFADQTNVSARAVAEASVMNACIWALNPNATGALEVQGNAQVELGCGVADNSNDTSALDQGGGACLTAEKIKVVGGANGDCLSPGPETGITAFDDPLAQLAAPSYDDCDFTNVRINHGDAVLDPGVYCTRLSINTTGTVTLNPGLYVLDGARLSINGQATVVGSDVSFFLTENSASNDDISINGGANVTLSAPSDGPLPGILFFQDRNTPSNITHKFNGGSNMFVEGIIYFSNQDVEFTGGNDLQSTGAIVIADEIKFSGNAYIGDFENSPVLGNPLLSRATLVE
jgi:Flp pilus assembly protein TadG